MVRPRSRNGQEDHHTRLAVTSPRCSRPASSGARCTRRLLIAMRPVPGLSAGHEPAQVGFTIDEQVIDLGQQDEIVAAGLERRDRPGETVRVTIGASPGPLAPMRCRLLPSISVATTRPLRSRGRRQPMREIAGARPHVGHHRAGRDVQRRHQQVRPAILDPEAAARSARRASSARAPAGDRAGAIPRQGCGSSPLERQAAANPEAPAEIPRRRTTVDAVNSRLGAPA